MLETSPRTQTDSPIRAALHTVWKRREPIAWITLLAVVLFVQWPMLKGWYYGATGGSAPASAVAWRTDFDGALAEARPANKRVLAYFSASWCPPCVVMKHEVWPHQDVADAIGAAYVPLMVDADDDGGLSARYGVDAIPAVLLLDADGRLVKRHDGFLPRADMIRFLTEPAR